MSTHLKLTGIITLVVGVQLTAPGIAADTSLLNATTVASAADSQGWQKQSSNNFANRGYTPPDNGGPTSSEGSGTR